jgi:DNA-binding transcriptional ArsR family regulator
MNSRTHRSSPAEPGSAAETLLLNSEQAAQLLKMLANSQRLRMLCLLVDGELSVGQINERVELSQSALSQHLAKLREQGLVTTRREAQTIYYSLPGGPAKRIIGALHAIYCEPDGKARRGKRRRA